MQFLFSFLFFNSRCTHANTDKIHIPKGPRYRNGTKLDNEVLTILYSIVSCKHHNLEIPVEIFSHESIQSMPH